MSARYASGTSVSVQRTKGEIEAVLERYGASGFGYMTEGGCAMVAFTMRDAGLPGAGRLRVRIRLAMPDPRDSEFTRTPTGKERQREAALKAWEQACRASWRALLLVIRAKLEAVEVGISSIEREFMADVLLPSGETVGEVFADQHAAIVAGERPLMLTMGGGG
jgi:hypothetical protein